MLVLVFTPMTVFFELCGFGDIYEFFY